jgi:hypothetical protein
VLETFNKQIAGLSASATANGNSADTLFSRLITYSVVGNGIGLLLCLNDIMTGDNVSAFQPFAVTFAIGIGLAITSQIVSLFAHILGGEIADSAANALRQKDLAANIARITKLSGRASFVPLLHGLSGLLLALSYNMLVVSVQHIISDANVFSVHTS